METNQNLKSVLRKIKDLERDLSAEIVIQEGSREEHTNKSWGDRDSGGYGAWGEHREIPERTVPDTQKREATRAQLNRRYSSSEDKVEKYLAGRALGINVESLKKDWGSSLRLKLWIYENPIKATVAAVAGVGAVSGLGYMLYQYLSR